MADKNYILTIDQYGRRVYKDISTVKGVNAETLDSLPVTVFTTSMTPEKQWAYRIQGDLTLQSIEYPLYVLDAGLATTTLTLPPVTSSVAQGTIITLLNPTKGNFVINGNGVNIVRVATEAASITLTEYQSIKLILLDIGQYHDWLWYELISIPAGVGGYTHPATHPPSIIAQDVSNRFVSDTEKSTWNNAEVNVNADWNASSGDAQIINKPTISGTNTGDETSLKIGAMFAGVAAKATPIDVDNFGYSDSENTNIIKKLTWANLKATLKTYFDILYNPIRLFTNLTGQVATSGTTEKVLLQLTIPAARAVVGSTFRAWIIGNSSSTGTLIFKVRCGAGGTITDAIDWTAVTSAAQAANARAGFDVLITIRSATTIKAEGVGYAGAIQLPTVIGAPTTPAIVISAPWYINLTVICSSGTFTAQVGNIEEIK